MLKKLLDSFELTPHQIKIFFGTFLAISIMVFLQHIGIHSPFAFLSLDK